MTVPSFTGSAITHVGFLMTSPLAAIDSNRSLVMEAAKTKGRKPDDFLPREVGTRFERVWTVLQTVD